MHNFIDTYRTKCGALQKISGKDCLITAVCNVFFQHGHEGQKFTGYHDF